MSRFNRPEILARMMEVANHLPNLKRPDELIAELFEINDILGSEEVRKAFSAQGMDPATGTPEAFGQLVARDADRWAALIKTQGIKAE